MGTLITVSVGKDDAWCVSMADIMGQPMAKLSVGGSSIWFDDAEVGLRIVEKLAQAMRAIKAGPIGNEGDDGQLHAAKEMRDRIIYGTESEATDDQREAYDAEFGEPAVRAALDARADWNRVAAAGEF